MNKEHIFGIRLKELRERKNFTQDHLAETFCVTRAAVGNWEREAIPREPILSGLADIFDVSVDYLLGRTNDPIPQNRYSSFQDQVIPIDSFRQIPLVGYGSCGELLFSEQNIEEYISFPANFLNGGEYFALRVIGDSMIDAGILEGSVIIVRKQSTCDSGDIVVVCVKDEITVKRVFFNGNQIELVPENRKYPRKSYPAKAVTIQGVVKKSLSDVV